uniref:Biotin carboxylation domain-containing protein n=1 Tax=Macrostomum lignano TaxID=282301 RepID=A0A1I8JSF5_9PLAT
MQCRVTTEDPERDFQPDSGRLEYFRPGLGPGIRLDSASAFAGAIISPYYDSLLCKVVAHTGNFAESTAKMRRALREFRVIGVSTNIAFLLNLLSCEEFCTVAVDTGFLDRNPQLMRQRPSRGRVQKLLRFIAETLVNGPQTPVPNRDFRIPEICPEPPAIDYCHPGSPGVLLTDTTMRDAHQSLLATRVRTYDLVKIAPFAARRLSGLLSMECWGGATFDVSLRFLHECPWQRLRQLRDLVPNIPFQMLLRGANAVGYTNYADNVVYRFCEEAVKTGMDIFRIFDCLNYVPNMLKRTGLILDTNFFRVFVKLCFSLAIFALDRAGAHILAIKDMAGLLKPESARRLVTAFEAEIPRPPAAHSYSRHGAGAGVATLLALLRVRRRHSRRFRRRNERHHSATVHGRRCRLRRPGRPASSLPMRLYVNFECTNTMRSGNADVYENEIPGGQYTNLHFQSISLGLADQFALVKKKFAEANQLLGDLIKVTPSSKVVGDLAQFMVQNKLSKQDVLNRASELSFPCSVVQFFDGCIGQPHGGFPVELAAAVLHGRKPKSPFLSYRTDPQPPGTPAVQAPKIPPFDFEKLRRELEKKCFFEVNGQLRVLRTRDREASKDLVFRRKAQPKENLGEVGAPMPGEILSVRVTPGQVVAKGQPLLALSAMKMELTVASPLSLASGEDRYDAGHAHKYSGHIERQSHPALAACLPAPIVNAPLGQHSMRTKRKNQCRKAERHDEPLPVAASVTDNHLQHRLNYISASSLQRIAASQPACLQPTAAAH